ncbi:hypothetical protein HYX07_03430 [Candidatus Woesearchaeota archaeon]|nr:hypothetical protein [Candidatus Woesearchaeota archaeon]
MVKKRGKPKAGSKKIAKKDRAQKKKPIAEAPKPVPMKDALRELDILAEEKKVEGKVEGLEQKEGQVEKKELAILTEEKKIEKQAEKVEKMEKLEQGHCRRFYRGCGAFRLHIWKADCK